MSSTELVASNFTLMWEAMPSGKSLYKKQHHHVSFQQYPFHRKMQNCKISNSKMWRVVSDISTLWRYLEDSLLQDVVGANADILSLLAMLAVIYPATGM